MEKFDVTSWPVLVISAELTTTTAVGDWTRAILENLEHVQHCSVIKSYSWEDAYEIVSAREDLGTIIIDTDLKDITKDGCSETLLSDYNDIAEKWEHPSPTLLLVEYIRYRNKTIPILLMQNHGSVENISDELLAKINGTVWKLNSNSPQYHAGHIQRHVKSYAASVMPPFFGELVKYVNEYNTSWHTPGHMGGQGFLRSPAGTAFHKFYGEDVLRADLSVSVPELGSLLEHSGVTGEAEQNSAKVFGADDTFYVLGGTTAANEIVWKSKVLSKDKTLMDRNCHKSLACAMIMTDAAPSYMMPVRNALGMMGPVDFRKIQPGKFVMSALTNSTDDGICYNMTFVGKYLKDIKNQHFDEAWFAYAKFNPMYKNHFAMSIPRSDKMIYATQSTHKLLTAFSQASMIHMKLPEEVFEKPDAKKLFRDLFNETYIMFGSTSPQYDIIASLDVATKMMQENGEVVWTDTIIEAIQLRKKVAGIYNKQLEKRVAASDKEKCWFFNVWQPDCIATVDTKTLAKNQSYWVLKPEDTWHGFEDIEKDSVMLDPIKITFICPGKPMGAGYDETGIPATIVANYLRDHGVFCEKTDHYTFLLLNSLGTTKGKQGSVMAQLFKFKEAYDADVSLEHVFPDLVGQFPVRYAGQSLKFHCQDMHEAMANYNIIDLLDKTFTKIPPQELRPAQAYHELVAGNVELMEVDKIVTEDVPRIAATAIIPHPPAVPMLIGGEMIGGDTEDGEILNPSKDPTIKYLLAIQDFEKEFPGYEHDILGVNRTKPDDSEHKKLQIYLIKQ